MTKPRRKLLSQLAEESWLDIEPILLEDMRMKMRLHIAGYIKGYRKGKEDECGVCTRKKKE